MSGVRFQELFSEPLRNGLTRPKAVRGAGTKMVNMGEVFAYPRIPDIKMDRVPLSEAEAERYLLQSGDLLFARQSLVLSGAGKCCYVLPSEEPRTFESHIIRARLDRDLADPLFYYYFFNSPLGRQRVESIVEQVAAAGIRGRDLAVLDVPFPRLKEQEAISHILGTLDDKIELNRRMNETLECTASAIFKSWFVEFNPVRAKMEGGQPVGMEAETAALFPNSFEDSPIGKIPKGWRTTTIAELTEINALSLTKEDPLAFVEYIEISAVSQGNVGNIVEYARGTEPSRARRRVRHGDTVLSTVRPERRAFFLVLNPSQQLIVSTGFAVISPSITPWSYIHAALTQPDVFLHLGQLADGGAYPAINPNVIGSWEVCSPCTPAVLDSFHNICASLYERADNNRRECRVLADIRDALLPKLISGEIMVKDADKFVEEHAC